MAPVVLALKRSSAFETRVCVTAQVLRRMEPVLRADRSDVVLVHGNTTTTLAASLAAFYKRIPIGHVEAGLRTHGGPRKRTNQESMKDRIHLARWINDKDIHALQF